MTSKHKTIWVTVVILVVIIIAAFIVLLLRKHGSQLSTKSNQSQQSQKIVQPTYAPSGQLVSSFPKDLLIGIKPTITQSYSLPYKNQSQATTTYLVQETPAEIFQASLAYLNSHSYDVLSKQQAVQSDTIYATGNGADISVVILPDASQSMVVVSYLTKQL
jgi:flagellar basal body-associated protein FliL